MTENQPQYEHRPASVSEAHSHPSRRAFLKASGFALFFSALEGCSRAPVQYAKSPLDQPEGAAPGKSDFYASVCGGCTAAIGILVEDRDGGPIKLEGNTDHPLFRGGLGAVGQASVADGALDVGGDVDGGAAGDVQRIHGRWCDGAAAKMQRRSPARRDAEGAGRSGRDALLWL